MRPLLLSGRDSRVVRVIDVRPFWGTEVDALTGRRWKEGWSAGGSRSGGCRARCIALCDTGARRRCSTGAPHCWAAHWVVAVGRKCFWTAMSSGERTAGDRADVVAGRVGRGHKVCCS